MKIGVATCKPGKLFARGRCTKDSKGETKIFSIWTLSPPSPNPSILHIYRMSIGRTATHSEIRIQPQELTYICPSSPAPGGSRLLTCCSYLCLSSSNCQENSSDCFSRSDFDLLRSASTFSIYMVKEREYLIFFFKGIA